VLLSANISRLESSGLLLSEAISIVNNNTDKINKSSGRIGNEIFSKFKTVLEKNCGFKKLCLISKVLNGELEIIQKIDEELTEVDLVYFKFSPITSIDVKRSFSRYRNYNYLFFHTNKHFLFFYFSFYRFKNLLASNRRRNTMESLKKPSLFNVTFVKIYNSLYSI
jgi:hypothetical protein